MTRETIANLFFRFRLTTFLVAFVPGMLVLFQQHTLGASIPVSSEELAAAAAIISSQSGQHFTTDSTNQPQPQTPTHGQPSVQAQAPSVPAAGMSEMDFETSAMLWNTEELPYIEAIEDDIYVANLDGDDGEEDDEDLDALNMYEEYFGGSLSFEGGAMRQEKSDLEGLVLVEDPSVENETPEPEEVEVRAVPVPEVNHVETTSDETPIVPLPRKKAGKVHLVAISDIKNDGPTHVLGIPEPTLFVAAFLSVLLSLVTFAYHLRNEREQLVQSVSCETRYALFRF